MSALRKKLLLAGATAALAISAFGQTPFAQNNGNGGNTTSQPSMGAEASANTVPGLADKKAEAAMTAEPNSTPPTDADRKAAAAMRR